MKKMIFTLAITTFIASTVLVGCQGSTKKEEAAKDKIEEARDELDDAKEELKRALKAYKGSILLICHEPDFYEGLATDVWDCRDWALRLS